MCGRRWASCAQSATCEAAASGNRVPGGAPMRLARPAVLVGMTLPTKKSDIDITFVKSTSVFTVSRGISTVHSVRGLR